MNICIICLEEKTSNELKFNSFAKGMVCDFCRPFVEHTEVNFKIIFESENENKNSK